MLSLIIPYIFRMVKYLKLFYYIFAASDIFGFIFNKIQKKITVIKFYISMLANKIFSSKSKFSFQLANKVHKKVYKKGKLPHPCNSNQDKQNQGARCNTSGAQVVDLSKKIKKKEYKKISKFIKSNQSDHSIDIESYLGLPVYEEEDLGFDEELANLIRPHEVDNDADTDQEQVQAGSKKMAAFLKEACRHKKLRQYEDECEFLGSIMDPADVARMQNEDYL